MEPHNRQSDDIESIVFSPDDQTLASGSIDGEVKLWDVRTAQELATFHIQGYGVKDLSFSPDGSRLVAAIVPARETAVSKVYWADQSGAILRADPDGTDIETIISDTDSDGVAIYENKLYWTEEAPS